MESSKGHPVPLPHHPKFYYDDGTIVIKVTDGEAAMLYCLHKGILVQQLHLFLNLSAESELQSSPGPHNGDDDDHPLILSPYHVTPAAFDHLLTYLMCGPCDYPLPENDLELYNNFLLTVLNLSSFMSINDGVSIKDWIDPGFRQLIKIPLWSISQEDTVQIGPVIYNALVVTRAHINRLHASLAFCPPSIVNDPAAVYWHHVVLAGNMTGGMDVLQELAATQPSGKETFKKEEEYIDEAIVALSVWQETGKIPQLY
ncbi:hypothetical protein BDQ17DRAFT_1433864 [Cyathus striatus]|nr:hypothetical protein BDQ17DRAFT_1433864 [Cyathus striatus]